MLERISNSDSSILFTAVFHVDRNDGAILGMALSNIENLLLAIPQARVHLVANGDAVALFQNDSDGVFVERLRRLSETGARFALCRNSLRAHGIEPHDVVPFCEIVEAGIVELIRLQHDGCAYIKP